MGWEGPLQIWFLFQTPPKVYAVHPTFFFFQFILVYYEAIERELNRRLIYECRCDEILKGERSTRLAYTGFRGGLEHLKIETRLTDDPEVLECDG